MISALILKILGWKINGVMPEGVTKCVVVVAPHTSNMDFILGRLGFNVLGIRTCFLIKKEFFFFPVGPVIKLLGAIPVDRKNNTRMIEKLSALFAEKESLIITITPEGTRKLNPRWKKGFYTLALRAKVPIGIGYLDYKKKEIGIAGVFDPTGDYENDMEPLYEFYRSKTARFPENFNLSM